MAGDDKASQREGAGSWFSPEHMARFTWFAVLLALAIEVIGHLVDQLWDVRFLYNMSTLLGVLLLMSPIVFVIALLREKPLVRMFLVLAGLGLGLTVLLDLTKDIASIEEWPLIGNNSAVRGNLRWFTLVGGIFLLFAALYQAISELVASRQRLQAERLGLLEEMRQRALAEESAQAARDYAQNLIQTANVMVIGLDAGRQLTVYNEAAERITGYSRKELEDLGWFNALMPRDRYPLERKNLLHLVQGGLPKSLETPILTKSGEERLIAWSNSEVYERGVFAGTISFGSDITERRKAEVELLRSSKLATLGVVAAGLAHEIGNPLASLSARLRLMEEDNDPQFWRESFNVLGQQIMRISRIVRGVSRFSRPLDPGVAKCNVNVLITDALDVVRFHTLAKRCEIRTELATPSPMVLAAADQLVQVFLNLGLNALEAMPEGGTLIVSTRMEGAMAAISFRDTGMGVPEENRQKVFDTFYTTKEDGMGLGLSIVRAIVLNHQGRIECGSAPEGGACFRVLLPAYEGDPAPAFQEEG